MVGVRVTGSTTELDPSYSYPDGYIHDENS